MEYSDYYSEEDEDYYQSTTNEEFYRENNMDTKFKKWLNSDTDISHISSIYRLELENSNGMKSQILNENQKKPKNNENENGQEDKSEKEYEEENIGDEISEEEIKEMKSEENNTEETLEDTNNNKKNYTFIWDEGGNDVKITGSFSDWKIKFQMTKEPNNQIFKCTLPLGNEIYQYKFIVDGEWKFSKKFPTKDDGNGNINNILDNTKNILVQPKEGNKEEKKPEKKEKTKKIKKKAKTKNKTKNKQSLISTKTKTTKTRASTVNKDKNEEIKNFIKDVTDVEDIEVEPSKEVNHKFKDNMKFVSLEFGITKNVPLESAFMEKKPVNKETPRPIEEKQESITPGNTPVESKENNAEQKEEKTIEKPVEKQQEKIEEKPVEKAEEKPEEKKEEKEGDKNIEEKKEEEKNS